MKTPTLKTERLVLKRGTYDDYVKVYEYDMTKLRNINGEFEYVKKNPEEIREYETYALEEDKVIDFIIYLKDTMYPIGNLVYDRYNKEYNSLEISCNMHPDYWQKGYMTEAIISSMNYIFNNEDIDNIIYGYAEENVKSCALSNKIGFNYFNFEIEHYSRINKDIKEIKTIMSKKEFMRLYKSKCK